MIRLFDARDLEHARTLRGRIDIARRYVGAARGKELSHALNVLKEAARNFQALPLALREELLAETMALEFACEGKFVNQKGAERLRRWALTSESPKPAARP